MSAVIVCLLISMGSIAGLTFVAYTHNRRQDELTLKLTAACLNMAGAEDAVRMLRPLGSEITRKELFRLLDDHVTACAQAIENEMREEVRT